jgi:hypothetical protein
VWCKVKTLITTLVVAVAGITAGAAAQSIEFHQWQGTSSFIRQPDQVVANTMAEWRSLWSRVGAHAPDIFEPGRTHAVGIFLGPRNGPGYGVNVLSAVRRRDRIMLVFEERGPPAFMMAQRTMPPPPPPPQPPQPRLEPTSRALSAGPLTYGVSNNFAPQGAAGFAPPGPPPAVASRPVPPPSMGPPSSPWAIVLINRADLPITVEQRLFR